MQFRYIIKGELHSLYLKIYYFFIYVNYFLNTSLSSLPKDLPTTTAVVFPPLTLSIVLPISKIGSIARIPPANGKYGPRPIPDKTTETDIVAVPGSPAIPSELIVITMISIM